MLLSAKTFSEAMKRTSKGSRRDQPRRHMSRHARDPSQAILRSSFCAIPHFRATYALTACSAARSSSIPAWLIASSRLIGPGQIEKYASIPCSRTASAPGPIEPANARTGQWSERASRPTPTAVLPNALWASMAPSPVKHRSALSSRCGQVDCGDDQVDAGLELAPAKATSPAAQTAGGARAGLVLDRHAQVAVDDRREMGQVAVERFDHLRGSPLLRAVNRRGPVGPHRGLVTSQATAISTPSSSWSASGAIDASQSAQMAAAGVEVAAGIIEEAKAERLAQAGPAVVGRAAADANDDPPRSGGDRRQQELAGAARGGDQSGLRFSAGTRTSPDAAAISITAV